MRRLGLIAGREIGAYAGVPSFWVALLMGPLLMVLTGLAARSVIPTAHAPEPRYVAVVAADPALQEAASAALRLAGQREGRETIIRSNDVTTAVRIAADDTGAVNVRMQGEALPSASMTLLSDGLASVERRARLRAAGASPKVISAAETPQVVVHEPAPPPAAPCGHRPDRPVCGDDDALDDPDRGAGHVAAGDRAGTRQPRPGGPLGLGAGVGDHLRQAGRAWASCRCWSWACGWERALRSRRARSPVSGRACRPC
jgi:hypothetical protein